MATEPITLFAKIADPVRALRILREISPKLGVVGDEQSWSRAIVSIGIWPLRKRFIVESQAQNVYWKQP
jgi:hypothetical protein